MGTEKGSFGWWCSGWEEEGVQGEEGGVPAPSMHMGLTPAQSQHPVGGRNSGGDVGGAHAGMSLKDADIQGLFSPTKSLDFMQMGPCPPLEQHFLRKRDCTWSQQGCSLSGGAGLKQRCGGGNVMALAWLQAQRN